MLKLQYNYSNNHNSWYFTFIDEFSNNQYGGKTFQTLSEAVEYARENITYKGNCFDLISISRPEYITNNLDIH